MRTFVFTLFLWGCFGMAMGVPASLFAGVAHAASAGGATVFSSSSSAGSYAKQQLHGFSGVIMLRLQTGSVSSDARKIAERLQAEGLTTKIGTTVTGSLVTFIPEYADDALLLQAYRDPQLAGRLDSDQKKALKQARSWVGKALSHYHTEYERALALHDYLVGECEYSKSDMKRSHAHAVIRMLTEGHGICDGYALTYRLLLNMAGIQNEYVTGSARGIGHSWNLAKLDGHWVHIDCTYDDPIPDISGRLMRSHFAMTDEQIGASHTWNRKAFHKASTPSLYWPTRYGRHFRTAAELVAWCQSNFRHLELEETFYVEEFKAVRSDAEIRQKLEQAQNAAGAHVLRNFSFDHSVPGVIFCRF